MQREAALHMKGPLLIVAGAGVGKTKTITHRIVNLIKEGVSPDKILAVTFTNKAAKEMRERISFAIKDNAKALGLTRHFTILDESDSVLFIKEILKELGLDPK